MKKPIYFLLFATIMTIVVSSCDSCKKPVNPINEGVSTYLPTNTQNFWNYEASDGTLFKRYWTGRDTVIDGFSYNYFEQISTGGTIVKEFYAKFNGQYYTLVPLDDSGTIFVKAIVLGSDTPQVGDTWTNEGTFDYASITFTAKVDGEVLSVTDTATVDGQLMDSIVTVKNHLYAKMPFSTYQDCGTMIMKIKKGVGIVSEDYDFHVGTFVNKQYSNWLLNFHVVQ